MEKVGLALLLAVTAGCAGHVGSGDSGAGGDGAAGTGGSSALPACRADGTVEAPASLASGSVVGDKFRAAICPGGAKAYVEVTSGSATLASQTVFVLDPMTSGDPQTRFAIQLPEHAVEGAVDGLIGMTGPAPGSYSSETDCGAVGLCAWLPIPADLDCSGSGEACPPGCALQGPVSGPTCQPFMPDVCYSANAARSCLGETAVPHGSWSLTVTSVEAYAPDMGAPNERFVAHGALTAEVWADDNADSAQVSVAFWGFQAGPEATRRHSS
jgi:hypothetical protein